MLEEDKTATEEKVNQEEIENIALQVVFFSISNIAENRPLKAR